MIEAESWKCWVHEIRRIEFERTIEQIPLGRDSAVLELGCGDGFQLRLLSKRFARVYAIDPEHRPSSASGFCFSVAEALPFPDCWFDLVVSCCVIEHMQDRRRALEEAVRVLKPGGWMAHIVPAVFWKATSLVLNPIGYPMSVVEKWRELQKSKASRGLPGKALAADPRPGVATVLRRWIYPPVHGTYRSHLAELKAYSASSWRRVFSHPELQPVAQIALPARTQFGFLRYKFLSVRQALGRHGFASSHAFILRKVR
ncbi:MAG: class I SAM-dependent methyltransferase [Deltaproteobacteria bacterium]